MLQKEGAGDGKDRGNKTVRIRIAIQGDACAKLVNMSVPLRHNEMA